MSSRNLDRYEYTLMKEAEVDGHKVWQVEAIPNEQEVKDTGYTKSILFVRQDNHVVVRSVGWVKKGKRNRYMQVKGLEQVEGIWVATEIHMATKKHNATLHRTVLKISNVSFGNDLSQDTFSIRRLEKGL